MGDSGGAGIAAGAAILARDRGVPLAKQILIYPMLDDRTVACDDELDGLAHVWFAENDKMAWYAKRLMAAHVPAELHVLTGLTHTFDTFPLPIADKAFEYRSYVISQL